MTKSSHTVLNDLMFSGPLSDTYSTYKQFDCHIHPFSFYIHIVYCHSHICKYLTFLGDIQILFIPLHFVSLQQNSSTIWNSLLLLLNFKNYVNQVVNLCLLKF